MEFPGYPAGHYAAQRAHGAVRGQGRPGGLAQPGQEVFFLFFGHAPALLFGVPARKDARGSGAYDPEGIVQVALRAVRDAVGEELVLMLTDEGLVFLDPTNGKERLNYGWKFKPYRALQPCLLGNDTILLPTGMSAGTRAIRIAKPMTSLRRKSCGPRETSSRTLTTS